MSTSQSAGHVAWQIAGLIALALLFGCVQDLPPVDSSVSNRGTLQQGAADPPGSMHSAAQSSVPMQGTVLRSPTPAGTMTASPLPPEATLRATTTALPLPTASATLAISASPSVRPTLVLSGAFTPTLPGEAVVTVGPTYTPTPGPTPDGQPRTLRVPILMYHYISEPPPGSDVYRKDLSVTPAQFESHLKYLRDNGYHVVSLDVLLYSLAQGRELPSRPVILTFDDGYRDNYINAFPLLRRYGMVAYFFVITDFVNQERPEYMSWGQIEKMSAAGQLFGSHSRDHPDLRNKSVDYLVWQALGSREAIEEHLGYHPRWIAYPSGGYDANVIAVYKSAHFWGGLTTQQGATHSLADIFELRRVRVRGTHSAADLATLLNLDW